MIPLHIQQELGKELRATLEERNLTNRNIAEVYHDEMGFGSVDSAVNHLSKLNRGKISGSQTRVKLNHLARQRLSIYIAALGIDEGSILVQTIENLDSNFEYAHEIDPIPPSSIPVTRGRGRSKKPKNSKPSKSKPKTLVQRSLERRAGDPPSQAKKQETLGRFLRIKLEKEYGSVESYAQCCHNDFNLRPEEVETYVTNINQGFFSGKPNKYPCTTPEQRKRLSTYVHSLFPARRDHVHQGLLALVPELNTIHWQFSI